MLKQAWQTAWRISLSAGCDLINAYPYFVVESVTNFSEGGARKVGERLEYPLTVMTMAIWSPKRNKRRISFSGGRASQKRARVIARLSSDGNYVFSRSRKVGITEEGREKSGIDKHTVRGDRRRKVLI